MKALLAGLLLTSGLACEASIIDEQVASYKTVVTLSPVTYQNLPVASHAAVGQLCKFLGYKVELDRREDSGRSPVVWFSGANDAYGFTRDLASPGVITILTSLTCAK